MKGAFLELSSDFMHKIIYAFNDKIIYLQLLLYSNEWQWQTTY